MSTTPSTFITGLYTNVLRRTVAAGTATNAELLSWDALITANLLTQAQVTTAIVNSAEATNVVAPIVRIYQTFFNRVPDSAGLDFWVGRFRSGTSLASISSSFSAAPEFNTSYGTPSASTIDAFLTALYTNVLGRAADAGGFAFWKAQFAANGSNAAAAAAIANSFSSSPEFVTASATNITNLLTAAASSGSLGTGRLGGSSGSGSNATFTLTTGTDTLTGTTGNDLFVATSATTSPSFQSADSLDGGAGTDVLNLTIDALAANSVPAATVTAIETINVRNVSGNAQTIIGTNFVGHTTLNNNVSTGALTFNNISSGTNLIVTGNGTVTNGASTFNHVAGATAAALTLTGGVTAGAIVLTGTGIVATTIKSSGTVANTVGAIVDADTSKALTINAAVNLTATSIATATAGSSMTISGAAASVSIGTLDTDYTTVNAGGLTAGGLTAVMSATVTTVLTGGAGNDVITTGATLTTGSVAAGTGTDRLIVVNSAHLNTAALGAKYTGFEVLQVENGVSVDLDQISGITAIRINGGAAATGVTNLTATQAGAITVGAVAAGALTIAVKNAANAGQIDTVSLSIDDGLAGVNTLALGTPVIGSVEKLNLSLTDNVTITALTAAPALDTITLTGAGTANITTGAISTINFTINGSAMTGGLTVTAAAFTVNGVAVTGGSAVDNLTGSGQADTLNGGAGADTLTGGLGADTLTGGAGADIFAFATNGSVAGTSMDVITDFNTGGSDVLQFGATGILRAADATALAAETNVQQSAGGLVTFAAADNTLALKITAIQADTQLDAVNSVAFFVDSGNTYFYYAGAATGNSDDQIVQLTGITSLTTITAGASNTIA